MSEREVIHIDPTEEDAKAEGKLKMLGGSQHDDFNRMVANQTTAAVWVQKGKGKEQGSAIYAALSGIAPTDEIEGMLAAQMVASHNAAMECYRRAMIPTQPFEAWKEDLTQANKLSRTFATLTETLNKHRGKGQQKVTVEHVHVHAGGQAIVGNVETKGGDETKMEGQPHAIGHDQSPPMRCENPQGHPVPVTSNEERALPDARGKVAGGTKGQQERS